MGEKTAISWTDATFNPWWGCVKVSPGCDNCYAEREALRRWRQQKLWGLDSTRRTFNDAHWNEPKRWARRLPAKLGRRPRVFCASMADVFDKDAPDGARERLWNLIAATPELDWLLLTKRVGNVARMVDARWMAEGWPDNVWMGISVVNQEEANRDIPKLLELRARVRWLSIEPMLGPVDLNCIELPREYDLTPTLRGRISALVRDHEDRYYTAPASVDWVVVGGESGPHARPMSPAWEREVREQCVAAGVPYHFKQWGEWAPLEVCATPEAPWTPCGVDKIHIFDEPGKDPRECETVFKIGKKAAGNKVYDESFTNGRTWQEFPR